MTPLLGVESNGFRFVVETRDRSLGPRLFAKQGRGDMATLRRAVDALDGAGLLRERRMFLDGGANIGTTSLAAIGLGFDEVVAFEPEPGNAVLLRANAALNGLHERVRVHELALSSAGGTARLDVTKGSSVKPRIRSDDRTEGRTFLEVRTEALEALVERGELDPDRVDLFWLDIEGHELQALLGAGPLLERGVPLVFEFNSKLLPEEDARRLVGELLPAHYDLMLDLGADRNLLEPLAADAFDPRRRGRKFADYLVCRR